MKAIKQKQNKTKQNTKNQKATRKPPQTTQMPKNKGRNLNKSKTL